MAIAAKPIRPRVDSVRAIANLHAQERVWFEVIASFWRHAIDQELGSDYGVVRSKDQSNSSAPLFSSQPLPRHHMDIHFVPRTTSSAGLGAARARAERERRGVAFLQDPANDD
jgi:hypothetical protein